MSGVSRVGCPGLALDPEVVAALEAVLPRMAERTVTAVIAEVPAYADAVQRAAWARTSRTPCRWRWGRSCGWPIRAEDTDSARVAVAGPRRRLRTRPRRGPQRPLDRRAALGVPGRRPGGLARVVGRPPSAPGWPPRPSPGSPSWCSRSSTNCRRPACPDTPTSWPPPGRVRQRYLDALTAQLLAGESAETLQTSAERANWTSPQTLDRGVAARRPQTRGLAPEFGSRRPAGHRGPAGPGSRGVVAVLLVPDMDGATAAVAAARRCQGRGASSAPRARGCWSEPRIERAVRARTPARRRRGSRRHRRASGRVGAERRPGGRRTTCGAARWHRCTGCGPTPPSASPRRCERGCCTRGNATPSRRICSSTRRPCATG